MTRPFTVGEYNESISNTGDAKTRELGQKMVMALFEKLGPGESIAVLAVAITEAFLAVLHTESPLPEQNIQSIHTLIDNLHANVKEHEPCARRMTRTLRGDNGKAGKPQVH